MAKMDETKDYRQMIKKAINTTRKPKNNFYRDQNGIAGIENSNNASFDGRSQISTHDTPYTPSKRSSSYVSFGNSGQKSRRSKYERGNRGALKRSNE